jgi:hypothetical protein
MKYYCARLLMICLVSDGKPRRRNPCDYSFVVYRAKDNTEAFTRALALGKSQETSYTNDKKQMVRWAFVQIETVKCLGRRLDGMEVGSLLDVFVSTEPISFNQRFQPAKCKPCFDCD